MMNNKDSSLLMILAAFVLILIFGFAAMVGIEREKTKQIELLIEAAKIEQEHSQ